MNTKTQDLNALWRQRVSQVVGGAEFDTPGGGYSFSAILAEERELEKSNVSGDRSSTLLKLSVADPTWKMPLQAMLAGQEYFEKAWNASRYKDTVGVLQTPGTIMASDTHEMLAYLIQRRHQVVTEDGKGLTADWVQYSPGSIKRVLAEYLPTLLFGKNTELLFPSPSYQVIVSSMNLRGASSQKVPLLHTNGKWAFDMDQLTRLVTRICDLPEKFVMYVNLPHNPTGTGFTHTDWQALFIWADEHNVTLIVDEAYIDLRYRDDIVSALQVPGWERCCIVLQSVSKGWSATGMRFGWVIAHPTIIKALRKVMDVKDSGMFGASIVAGLYCLTRPDLAEETRMEYCVLHQKLANGLKKADFAGKVPDAGLCQFTPAPHAASGTGFAVSFKDAAECAKWFRSVLRLSVMHAEAAGGQWLRWAVTLQPVPECGLTTEGSIIDEAVRRLQAVQFKF